MPVLAALPRRRACLFALGIGEHVVATLITYPAVALAVSFLAWLVWFGN